MKNSGLYQIRISGEILVPDSYTLYLVPKAGTVTNRGIYPEPRSPQLDKMLNDQFTLKLDVSKKPYRIYCLDRESQEIAKHEIIFWFNDSSHFYGEHISSGFIISGFIEGDLDSGSPSLFMDVTYFKFNNIEFHPIYSHSAEYMIALKEKWQIMHYQQLMYLPNMPNNNKQINTKIAKNDRYNYHNN